MAQYSGRFRRVCKSNVQAVTGQGIDVLAVRFDDIGLIHTSHLDIGVGVRSGIGTAASSSFCCCWHSHVEASRATLGVEVALVAPGEPFGEGSNQFLFRCKPG